MDREQLKAWLDDGLSLDQIGALVGRDPSTIGYWCKKHDLTPNGRGKFAPRGGLPREELATLVDEGSTLAAIAEHFGVSSSTVRHWIKVFALPKPRTRRHADVEEALAQGRRTVPRRCSRHGETVFVIENSGRTRCRRCRIERVSEHRRRTKALLVAEAGGACQLCGYRRYQGALEFHHRDPKLKRFALSLRGITRSLKVLREEAKKCALLCANCHAEVEGGIATLE